MDGSTGDLQKNALLSAMVQALGIIAKQLGTTSLPTATLSPSAGSSAGYITINVGGTAMKVPVFNAS